jgi:hypothetical protein
VTAWFGGTVADFTVNAANQIVPSGSFPVWTNKACTVLATGLVNEDGGASPDGLVIARASGVYVVGAPDGTSVLWTKDSTGKAVALLPRPDLTYAPIGTTGGIAYDTDGVPYLTA